MKRSDEPPAPRRQALVLAAGKGTRFKSSRAKVLHTLCGKPLIRHVMDSLLAAGIERVFVVVGYEAERVREALKDYPAEFVYQKEQLGTGHAVMTALPLLEQLDGSVLVVYGDGPLITSKTLTKIVEKQEETSADEVLLTCSYEDPGNDGRIIRDENGHVVEIVEVSDATEEQKRIREINPGFYCFKVSSLLEALSRLSNDTAQGEYYLTDTVGILRQMGREVLTVTTPNPGETRGINDRLQLSEIEDEMRIAIARKWMLQGVSILNPSTVTIDAEVEIGRDTVIYPGAILEGHCRIGEECHVGAGCHLSNAELGDRVTVEDKSVIRDSCVGKGSQVGPFAVLREDARIGSDVRVGNFVEVKNSTIGDRSSAAHLTYLGDAEVGADVNIGAGTITCNFDGRRKNKTRIEDQVFIGSGVQLVAPVTIHKGAWIAAGSSITRDIQEGALGIARSSQENKSDWAAKRRQLYEEKAEGGSRKVE